MNNKEFISIIAGKTEMKPREAQRAVEALISVMGDSFQEEKAGARDGEPSNGTAYAGAPKTGVDI